MHSGMCAEPYPVVTTTGRSENKRWIPIPHSSWYLFHPSLTSVRPSENVTTFNEEISLGNVDPIAHPGTYFPEAKWNVMTVLSLLVSQWNLWVRCQQGDDQRADSQGAGRLCQEFVYVEQNSGIILTANVCSQRCLFVKRLCYCLGRTLICFCHHCLRSKSKSNVFIKHI